MNRDQAAAPGEARPVVWPELRRRSCPTCHGEGEYLRVIKARTLMGFAVYANAGVGTCDHCGGRGHIDR